MKVAYSNGGVFVKYSPSLMITRECEMSKENARGLINGMKTKSVKTLRKKLDGLSDSELKTYLKGETAQNLAFREKLLASGMKCEETGCGAVRVAALAHGTVFDSEITRESAGNLKRLSKAQLEALAAMNVMAKMNDDIVVAIAEKKEDRKENAVLWTVTCGFGLLLVANAMKETGAAAAKIIGIAGGILLFGAIAFAVADASRNWFRKKIGQIGDSIKSALRKFPEEE